MKNKIKLLVLAGGPSSEYEVSLRSADMVMSNLNRTKYSATLVVIDRRNLWKWGGKFLKMGDAINKIQAEKFDCVFLAMHGQFGEDGRIQALLDLLNISYTGSDVLSSALAMNKSIANIIFSANSLLVPKSEVIKKKNYNLGKIKTPCVVKPADSGSSIGVTIVENKKDLKKAINLAFKSGSAVLIQEYIKGREFTCGVIEIKDRAMALPPTEIISKSRFFDFKAKYTPGASNEITPASLSKTQTKQLQALALKAHQALGCKGMSRSDFILKGQEFYILETNTIPGLTSASLLPQAAKAAGLNFSQLLDVLILSAI